MNALPSSGVAVTQLQFAVFDPRSYQALGIISALSNLIASVCFAGFHKWDLRVMFICSVVLATFVGLTPLAFVMVAARRSDITVSLWSEIGALGIFATVLGGFASIFSVLPIDTLVTFSCGNVGVDRSSTAYATLLSFYSFGATVSGLVSAPILEAMGLDGVHWSSLPVWIVSTGLSNLLVIPLLLLVPFSPPGPNTDVLLISAVDAEA